MDLQWLWQGVVSNLVYAVLILAGGAVLTYLRARNSRWASPILYGLAGVALIAVILLALKGFATLSNQLPATTPDTVEMNIRTWLDAFKIAQQRQSDPESHFSLRVTLPNNIPMVVRRQKEYDRYVSIEAGILPAKEYQQILEKFSAEQHRRFEDELIAEMASLSVEWSLDALPFKSIRLSKRIPITADLTEFTFIKSLHEMGNAWILAGAKVRLALSQNP